MGDYITYVWDMETRHTLPTPTAQESVTHLHFVK